MAEEEANRKRNKGPPPAAAATDDEQAGECQEKNCARFFPPFLLCRFRLVCETRLEWLFSGKLEGKRSNTDRTEQTRRQRYLACQTVQNKKPPTVVQLSVEEKRRSVFVPTIRLVYIDTSVFLTTDLDASEKCYRFVRYDCSLLSLTR